MATNYIKDDALQRYLTVAFGLQPATGHLYVGKVAGASPNHQITCYNALGEGIWNKCRGAYWKGQAIPAADYNFHPGALATGMTTGPQIVDSFFDKDVPHSRTATIGYKIPPGLGAVDIEATKPDGFEGIFETKKCPNFDSSGVQTDFSYTSNVARCVVELLETYCRMPNLPAIYASAAAYWLSRIDFGNWVDFRDYHEQTETVDYTGDDLGHGLTASYYTDPVGGGVYFDTFVVKFVQPTIDIDLGSGAPAVGVPPDNFSAKFEGKIKAPFTGTITLSLTHNEGGRIYIDDVLVVNGWTENGTHTGTVNWTRGDLHEIRVEWFEGTTDANLKFEWSYTGQTLTLVPSEKLYPKPELQKLHECNAFFETPVSPGAAIREMLKQTNSFMQDVNGKLRFFSYEQLNSTVFDFDEALGNIESFEFRPKDILQSEPVTGLEADFKDTDHQFLNKPAKSVALPLDNFTRKIIENIKTMPLFPTTRRRAMKILTIQALLNFSNNLIGELIAPTAKSYAPMPGSVVSIKHRKIGAEPKSFLIKRAVDKGISGATGSQGNAVERRSFEVIEWAVVEGVKGE